LIFCLEPFFCFAFFFSALSHLLSPELQKTVVTTAKDAARL